MKHIVGIDLGSSKICGAVGKVNSNGLLQIIGITSVACSGLNKSVVTDIDSTTAAIKQCISQLECMIDSKITDGYISLPGVICDLVRNTGIIAISSDDKEIKQHDVDRVIEAAKQISVPKDKEIVDAVPEQFIVDGYDNIKDPIGIIGERLEVEAQIIMAQSIVVSNILKALQKAGITVDGKILGSYAISEAILKKEEMDLGVALVDVGSETIDISIYKDGKLKYTSFIQLGGANITNDISVCLKVTLSEAERLKLKYGSLVKSNEKDDEKFKIKDLDDNSLEVERGLLVDIIHARVEELLHLIKINLSSSEVYNEVSGVVLVGGGISFFRGLNDLSKTIFDKSFRIGTPEYIGAASPVYSTAVGLVVHAAKDIKSSNDLSAQTDKQSYGNKGFKDQNKKEKKEFASKIKNFFRKFFLIRR